MKESIVDPKPAVGISGAQIREYCRLWEEINKKGWLRTSGYKQPKTFIEGELPNELRKEYCTEVDFQESII